MKRVILTGTMVFSLSLVLNSNEIYPSKTSRFEMQRFDYEADFDAFKEAVIDKDKETIDFMNQAEGTDADLILLYFEDPELMAQLKNANYEDLEVGDFNGVVALILKAYVTGEDEEGNETGSGVSLFFEESGSGLKLIYVFAAG